MRRIDLTGRTFGRLTVIELIEHPIGPYRKNWLCRCICGGKKVFPGKTIMSGHAKTCGQCEHPLRTHGMSGTPEYAAWAEMIRRCCDPGRRNFRDYGGRGISVCDSWRSSFETFYADIGPRPSSDHSLDRKDVNGNYEPTNVCWATNAQQNRNRRDTRRVTFGGRDMCGAEFAQAIGVHSCTVYRWLNRGFSPEQIASRFTS